MALPGVYINVLDGNLGLQPGSNEQTVLYMGCALGGTPRTLYTFGDVQGLTAGLAGGEVVEAAAYGLAVGGGPVMVMPLAPSNAGAVSAVTKVGTGAGTVTLSLAPHLAVTITCTTGGALGVAAFTFQLGSGAPSQPVLSAAAWGTTGYAVPGTFITLVFSAGTYVAGGTPDVYIVSALGVVTHPTGTGPTSPTFTASPVDAYQPRLNIVADGLPGTFTFNFALDYGANAATANFSATALSPAGGAYALVNPQTGIGTGIVLTFAGSFKAGDWYTFNSAGPTFSGTELTAGLTALQTTYLAQATYAMVHVGGTSASAAAWSTQVTTLESSALALFNQGVFIRFFNGGPTVGTLLVSGGNVIADSADTDSVVITARAGMSAPHVVPCAGDMQHVSAVSGLAFRRNASWAAAARASAVEASRNLGDVSLAGLPNVLGLYRDENASPGFDAAGITSLRTFPGAGASGFFITDAHTGAVATSDYYPLTNARVIDKACGIARINALPLVNGKIPTTTRNGLPGVITELKAQKIESRINSALAAGLVDIEPQDAVDTECVVNRSNNILATSNLILAVSVQPFGYARTVTVNIGMTISAT